MKNYWFITFFLFSRLLSPGQTNDSFSDGDFSANPAWSGSTAHFLINTAQQLQLNNSTGGSSYLSTLFPASSLDDFEWQVYVKQSFSPSGSNYGRVYLASDQSDLLKPLNGYYLQFGEAGSNDAVELFRQTGSASTSVCRASNGAIASSFGVRIMVQRDPAGLWKLYADYTGNHDFVLEASGTDIGHSTSSFMGVTCVYTSTNSTKFYYDDIMAGAANKDTTPPALETLKVSTETEVLLIFSEALNPESSSISNFFSSPGIGQPKTATLGQDAKTVTLQFSEPFKNGTEYHLTMTGIRDLAGNTMPSTQTLFLYFVATPVQRKDILITEIFPDVSPVVGLPEAEYIELYNRSDNAVDLSGWKLSDGTSTAVFPSKILLHGQYLIVTSSPAVIQFNAFKNTVGITGFPSLNNDGDVLTLKSPDGMTVNSVHYTMSYYGDADKADGGWSLELIDPNNPCAERANWTASEDPSGGTPGRQNSVLADKPDLTGPRLLSAIPLSTDTLLLTFDEKLEASACSTGSFALDPLSSIVRADFVDTSLRQIQLILLLPLQGRQLYTITVDEVSDCAGNPLQAGFSTARFALPEPADSLEVIVNEVLFNPRPNGVDFIEVYNHSQKYINLKGWKFGNLENGIRKNLHDLSLTDFMLAPQSYVAFTPDPGILSTNYPQAFTERITKAGLPGLPDDEGSIVLVDKLGKAIDYLWYSKNFHSEMIRDDEGVSLERISFSNPTNDPQNWKSASAQAGFATPGSLNSNARPETITVKGTVSIEPEVFIPNSGISDFAKINYAFESSGYIANVRVFDQEGHPIKTIARNESLGYEGFFRWDGDRDDGRKARIGYYVIWIEVFDTSGLVRTFRKRAILY